MNPDEQPVTSQREDEEDEEQAGIIQFLLGARRVQRKITNFLRPTVTPVPGVSTVVVPEPELTDEEIAAGERLRAAGIEPGRLR